MKTFCIVVCALAALASVQCQSVKDKVTATAQKCAGETKVTPEQAKIIGTQNSPATEPERCFLECIYSNLGVVKDGSFSVEGAKKLADVRFSGNAEELKMANHLIDTCSKEVAKKEGENCSLGRAIRECFVKNGKEINFFVTA